MQEVHKIKCLEGKWCATLRAHHFEQVVPKGDFFFYFQYLWPVRLEYGQKAPIFINNRTHNRESS